MLLSGIGLASLVAAVLWQPAPPVAAVHDDPVVDPKTPAVFEKTLVRAKVHPRTLIVTPTGPRSPTATRRDPRCSCPRCWDRFVSRWPSLKPPRPILR